MFLSFSTSGRVVSYKSFLIKNEYDRCITSYLLKQFKVNALSEKSPFTKLLVLTGGWGYLILYISDGMCTPSHISFSPLLLTPGIKGRQFSEADCESC